VKLTKSGKYEYLCAVPGHAAAGMKGLIGIGVAVTAAPAKTAHDDYDGVDRRRVDGDYDHVRGWCVQSAPPSGPDGCPGGTTIAQNTPTTGGDGDVDDKRPAE